jgi:hypothetical protein
VLFVGARFSCDRHTARMPQLSDDDNNAPPNPGEEARNLLARIRSDEPLELVTLDVLDAADRLSATELFDLLGALGMRSRAARSDMRPPSRPTDPAGE